MKTFIIFLTLLFILGCQKSFDLNEPKSESNYSTDQLSKFPITNDIAVSPDFNAYLIAENLTTPEGAVFHPKTKELLVTQSSVGNIITINRLGDIGEFCEVPCDNSPALIDLLFDLGRGIFVTSLRDGKIFLINKFGDITEFASELNLPLFMEMDDIHNLYVSELYGNCITRIDLFKNKTQIINFNGYNTNWSPRGIVFDDEENMYVLSGRTNEIMLIEINNSSDFPIYANENNVILRLDIANSPQDIAIGFDGDLFVVDNSVIWRIGLDGNVVVNVSIFVTGLNGPYNTIHSNRSGNLIVTDYGAGKVFGISKTKFAIN